MKKLLKIGLFAVLIIVVLAIATVVFINLPSTKKRAANYLINYLKQEYGLRLETDDLDYKFENGMLRVRLRNVRIYGGESNRELFFQSKLLQAEIPYSSLRGGHFLVKKLLLDTPNIHFENLPDLKQRETAEASTRTFEIQQIDFTGGALRYKHLPIQDIDLVARMKGNSIEVSRFSATYDTVRATGSAQIVDIGSPRYQVNYRAEGNFTSVLKIVEGVPPVKGEFTTEGKLTGKSGGYLVEGKVQSDRFSAYGEAPFPVSGTYRYDSARPTNPLKYHVEWESAPASLARRFEPEVPQIASNTSGTFTFEGGKNFWQGRGAFDVDLDYARTRGIPLTGRVTGELRNGLILLSRSNLTTGSTETSFQGQLSRSEMSLDVNANVRNPASLAFLSPELKNVPGSYVIRSQIEGPYKNLLVRWDLKGTAPELQLISAGSYRVASRTIQATFQANVRNPASLAFLSPELKKIPGSYSVQGQIEGPYRNLLVRWDLKGTAPEVQIVSTGSYRIASRQIQATFQGTADARVLTRVYPESPVNGTLAFEGKASGNVRSPVLSASVRGTDLSANGTEIGETIVNVQSDGRTLNADVQVPAYTTTARGSYHFRTGNFELQGQSSQIDLTTLHPFLPSNAKEVTGNFTATYDASGNVKRWKDAEAHVNLEQADLQYRDFTASVENATADLLDRTATVDLDALTSHGTVEVAGTLPVFRPGEMNLDVAGNTDMKFVSLVRPDLTGEGPVAINAHLGGTFEKPDYSGRIAAENFSVQSPDPPVELTNANMVAEFSGAEVALRGSASLNGSPMTISGEVPLDNRAGFVHLSLDNLSIASLATEADIRGTVSIDMDAHGVGRNPESWSGFFKIVPNQVVISGQPIEAPEPLEVTMTAGKMVLNKVRLKSGEILDAEAQGQVNFRTGAVEGFVRNNMNLSLISSFMSNTVAEGQLLADIKIGGTMKQPDLQGEIRIENGMFRRFQSPILLEQIQLRAPVEENQIRIESLTARMGGGTVEGGGTITLQDWKPVSYDLYVNANKVGMNYPESLRSQLNANLTLKRPGADFLIAGKVQVLRAIYREDIDPRDRIVNSLMSEKRALSTRTAAQGKIRLDVAVETVEDFQMRNNMGRVQAGANLQVRGLLEEPRIFGRIRIRERSQVYFEGNRFEVQRGIIDFYGQRRFNPVFDVELFTITTDLVSRQDYEITIPLSGELRDLDRREPTSYPPLAANQIYFLLLTGRANAQLGTASSRFFTQQLASFAAGQVFSDIQRSIARSFGLDRVEIQPELVSSETNPGAKLVLGKDFTSALSLVYSVSLTESQEQTWIANYKAPKNLSFRFVDQAEGSYTANMRHLIRFGEGTPTGKMRPPRSRKIEIERIELENDSVMSDQEVLAELDIEQGDTYDFWTVQEDLEKLEETLQKRGILFSSTQSEEIAQGSNRVALKIKVTGRERGEMIFRGWKVSTDQLEDYMRFWREGFSPAGVTEIIRESLLRDVWAQGYHKAVIQKEIETQNGVVQYRFHVKFGTQYPDTKVKFLQAEQYPADELEEDLIALYPGRAEMINDALHNFPAIERKIVALYVRRGFLETSVESGSLQLNAPVAIKNITVLEGKQSKIVNIIISDKQELPAELARRLKLKTGIVHAPELLLEDEVTIADYYERLGHRKVEVESSIENTGGGLTVHFDLKKGGIATIDSVEIKGAVLTKEKLIHKRVQLKEGEILNQDKLANAQKNLTDLRIFHQVTIRDIPVEGDPNRYRVVVDLIERNHYELTYGFRYDTETDLGGEVQLTDLNLFGTGQSISVYTRIHQQDQLYRLVYHSPTLSGLRWKTLVSTSYERGSLLLLEENEKFDGERFDVTIQRQVNLANNFLLIPGYQFEILTLTPLENPNIQPVEGLKVSRFIGTLLRDSRDDPFNATKGTFFSSDLQYAPGVLGDVNYVKNYNQYLRFRSYKRFLWASALRLGLATDLPERIVTERFFAGGSYSMRGFKKDEVGPELPDGTPEGGEALFVSNQEIRFPVWKWFGGVIFYDVGNVYRGLGDFNPFDIRHSVGIGLRLNSPFGIARLDYGINLSPEDDEQRGVFHFALGQAF